MGDDLSRDKAAGGWKLFSVPPSKLFTINPPLTPLQFWSLPAFLLLVDGYLLQGQHLVLIAHVYGAFV